MLENNTSQINGEHTLTSGQYFYDLRCYTYARLQCDQSGSTMSRVTGTATPCL